MTQEEKQILLVDICARLPYKVHCKVFNLNKSIRNNDDIVLSVYDYNIITLGLKKDECLQWYQIKPYLRPMPSMTEEEREDLIIKTGAHFSYFITPKIMFPLTDEWGEHEHYCQFDWVRVFDWLNAHHFDYRGLIPLNLALEAPENMYK